MPRWLRNSLVLAAAIGGALLLWVGFALLVAALLIVAIPFAIWSSVKRRRAPEGPATVEGSATRIEEKAVPEQPPEEKQPAPSDPKNS